MRVSALWVGPPLSAMEWVSLTSFVMHGAMVELYTDDLTRRVPRGVVLRDARPLVGDPPLRYGPRAGKHEGSYAVAANLARATTLARHGGWWTDTDVVCLKPLAPLDSGLRLAWETPPGTSWRHAVVNVALMRAERGDPLVQLLERRIRHPWLGSPWDRPYRRLWNLWALRDTARNPGNVAWGSTGGPSAMTRALRHYRREHEVMPNSTFYPVSWQNWERLPAMSHGEFHDLAETSYAVHLWAELHALAGGERGRRILEAAWAAPYLEGFRAERGAGVSS